jgi:S-adenosylmethionine hydrolase
LTVCEKFLDKKEAERIANSQFRSYEYLPLLASWLWKKKDVPYKKIKIPDMEENYIWCTDRFTDDPRETVNCKTTFLELSEIKNKKFSKLPFYERLADVPKKTAAITRGSSGYKDKRFLEIVVQGGSATKTFNLKVGDKI